MGYHGWVRVAHFFDISDKYGVTNIYEIPLGSQGNSVEFGVSGDDYEMELSLKITGDDKDTPKGWGLKNDRWRGFPRDFGGR